MRQHHQHERNDAPIADPTAAPVAIQPEVDPVDPVLIKEQDARKAVPAVQPSDPVTLGKNDEVFG